LRAATYGRGIWEWNLITTPDFQINFSNNSLMIFAAQSATFNGTITALNGYNSGVSLSCSAGTTNPPGICAANPASIIPNSAGTSFALNASGSPADYSFNLHAVGTDSTTLTHDFSLTLHIMDFALGAPSPNPVSVTRGKASATTSFSVSAAGSFAGIVTLSCSNLPAGAACQFQPSNSVSPAAGNPVSVSLAITTSSTTPIGTFPVIISAATPGATAKAQALTLVVGATPDYILSIANPSLTASVNSSGQFNGTLTALNGYASLVTLSCGTGAPPTCTVNPASATPSSASTPFAVSVSSNLSQSYAFNVTGIGADAGTITHSAPVNFSAMPSQNFDFTMGITPQSTSIPAGQPAIFSLVVNPTTGSFPNNVSFSCSKLPALATCSFNPTQVGSGSENSAVTFTLATTAPVAAARNIAVATFFLGFPLAALVGLNRRTLLNLRRCALATLLLIFIVGLLSCGGGLQGNGGGGSGSPGTPAGTYTITVTAICGAVTHTAQISLTVTP
jgi:hypothetical protein